MVHRQHDLLGLQAELHGHVLQSVDLGAIYIGLTRLAQAPITQGRATAVDQTLERRWTAVHGRGLHHLWHEPATARLESLSSHGSLVLLSRDASQARGVARSCPAARSTRVAGAACSTSTST